MEYHYQFLRKIKAIKPYLIEFEEGNFIKPKIYLDNCTIEDLN